jgi:hypothetical protein
MGTRIPDFAALGGLAPAGNAASTKPLSAAEHLQAAVAYSHMMTGGVSPGEAIILGQAAAFHMAAAGQTDAAAQLRPRNDRGSD